MKRIYGLVMRVLLVVACLAAMASVFDTFHRLNVEVSEALSRRYNYECMSRVTDEVFERRAKNEYGNYNARLVGCSGKDFFGSPGELLLIRRSGIDKYIPIPTVEVSAMGINVAVAFTGWGLGSLLMGFLLVFIYRVGRWMWTGSWALTEKSN